MVRQIEYFRTSRGECPFEEFLESLSAKDQAKAFWVLKLIEDLDRVPIEYLKKLADTDGIWECRVKSGSNAYRVFSFFYQGDTLVLTHGYSKKSRKTDPRQILKAENYKRDYLSRRKRK